MPEKSPAVVRQPAAVKGGRPKEVGFGGINAGQGRLKLDAPTCFSQRGRETRKRRVRPL